jgi:peroxiredoxin Q/BCP
MKRFSTLMLAGLIKTLFFSTAVNAAELSEGHPAPAFQLQDSQGKQHTLDDYRDHWLVLFFYPKDDTPGCTTESCNFRDDYLKIKALQAKILGISTDNSKSHKAFKKKHNLPFTLLSDPDGETAKAYGALWKLGPIKFAKRHSFIIDTQGVVKKIYRDVDPDEHSRQIIEDLKQLQVAEAKSEEQ